MQKKLRPLSPHLSIYKLPLAAKLSILHRFTGFVLFIGSLMIAWASIYLIYKKGELPEFEDNKIVYFFLKLILMGWSFSLFYHLSNGIRHLFWDMGLGFDLKVVKFTNYLVVFVSICMTLVSWLLAI